MRIDPKEHEELKVKYERIIRFLKEFIEFDLMTRSDAHDLLEEIGELCN